MFANLGIGMSKSPLYSSIYNTFRCFFSLSDFVLGGLVGVGANNCSLARNLPTIIPFLGYIFDRFKRISPA